MIVLPNINTVALKVAYDKGYRIYNGEAYAPNGIKLNSWINDGYYVFTVSTRKVMSHKRASKVRIHRLLAYQKYGI